MKNKLVKIGTVIVVTASAAVAMTTQSPTDTDYRRHSYMTHCVMKETVDICADKAAKLYPF